MLAGPIRHRRVRRTDFVAVLGVMSASGLPACRPIVPYCGAFDGWRATSAPTFTSPWPGNGWCGFVHVTYARQLAVGMRGRIEALVVAPDARRDGVGTSLANLARQRAHAGAAATTCVVRRTFPGRNSAVSGPQRLAGRGREFRVDVDDPAQ